MKMTLLTFDLLRRFEREYITENYTEKQEQCIANDARTAMLNRHYHNENGEKWTEDDIYHDFLRILKISKIDLTKRQEELAWHLEK